MKHILTLLLLTGSIATGAVVYSGVQNVPVPQSFDGVYLRISDGATTGAFPADWSTAPWINPFFGGVAIGSSTLLRPVITGADQIENLAAGTMIEGTDNFAAGPSGSTTHVGGAANQFALGVPGYLGFMFQPGISGAIHYGWMQLTISNSGAGTIQNWAYDDSAGTAIGVGAVPEPGRALLLLGSLCAAGLRRRR